MNRSLVPLALLLMAFYGAGFGTCLVVFLLLRERLVDKAINRRERELYGPLLDRVKQQAQNCDARRGEEHYRAGKPMAGGAGSIRLDAFGSRHRDG